MSFLDALAILGAGVGRGYRGSQELQRQLAAAKRKELMDERDMAIREQQQASQDALARAQATNLGSETSARDFTLGEARAASERGATPITSGGNPRLSIGGNNFNLPNRMDVLQNPQIASMLTQSSDEQFKAAHPDYFRNYPPAGTAAAALKNTPEARGRDYIDKILTGLPPIGLGEDETEYTLKTNKLMRAKLAFLMETDPEAINAFLQKATSADTTSKGKSKGSGNRFKVKVN